MRTALIRAGIAVIGVFALTAAGCRKSAVEPMGNAAYDRTEEYGATDTITMADRRQDYGPIAGVTRQMASILAGVDVSDVEVSKSDAVGVSDGSGEASDGETDTDEDARRQAEEAWNRCLTAYFGYIPTDVELDLFYRTVQAECGNTEPEDGIGAVADVIANRCRSDTFPDTLTEVITQKNQFTTWSNGAIAQAKTQPWVYEICDAHIREGAAYDDIYFFTAGEYNPYCKPAFIIGRHYFGR